MEYSRVNTESEVILTPKPRSRSRCLCAKCVRFLKTEIPGINMADIKLLIKIFLGMLAGFATLQQKTCYLSSLLKTIWHEENC